MRGGRGGRKRSKAKKAARAARAAEQQPKQRTQSSINKDKKAGRSAHAITGRKTKKQKRAEKKAKKKAAKTAKKKQKKEEKERRRQQRNNRGGPGSSGFNPPTGLPTGLPDIDLPGTDLPSGLNMQDPSDDSGNAVSGDQGAANAAADAAADQAAADSVNPADFGAQPPPYNAETCGNQMNYEFEKCLAIRNVRAFSNGLFQQLLKAEDNDMNAFFQENAEAVMKAYGDINTKFQECLKTVEAAQDDCMACANGDQSKCPPPQGENPAAMNVEGGGGTRRPRFKTRRGRRRSPKKI